MHVSMDQNVARACPDEKFVLGIRNSGLRAVVRVAADRVSGGVDGGPELYGRMYPASGAR